MHRASTLAALAGLALFATAAHAAEVPYQFTINDPSALEMSSVSLTASTAGTLIGNWDPVDNPTGTRTKPGIFGTFGDNENAPVPTTVNPAVSGSPTLPMGGGFDMSIDAGGGSVLLQNYLSMLSGPPSGSLAAQATMLFDSFRTRSPSSTYPGGVPITLPIGEGMITSLLIEQTDGGAAGVLTHVAGSEYSFLVAPTMSISGTIDMLDGSFEFGPVGVIVPMEGTILLAGDAATLTSLSIIDYTESQSMSEPLPPIPLDLPTVLPAGDTAHVVLNLTLQQINTLFQGSLHTSAQGVIVPEPAGLGALAAGLCLLLRRQRAA